MKTLFLSVPVGVNVRNILRSKVLSTLLEAEVHVVCFTPGARDPEFREEFQQDNLTLVDLPRYVATPAVKRLRKLERYGFFATMVSRRMTSSTGGDFSAGSLDGPQGVSS